MNGIEFFPQKLRELRGKRRRNEVAEAIGISGAALTYYETGQRTPDAKMLYKICSYYGISADYLIGLETKAAEYEDMKNKYYALRERLKAIKKVLEE